MRYRFQEGSKDRRKFARREREEMKGQLPST